MGKKPSKFYSVYERGTDRPIFIHGTAQQCADALHITRESFYTQAMWSRRGKAPQRYEITIDPDEEDLDDEMGTS